MVSQKAVEESISEDRKQRRRAQREQGTSGWRRPAGFDQQKDSVGGTSASSLLAYTAGSTVSFLERERDKKGST